jgi:hypothetical protein
MLNFLTFMNAKFETSKFSNCPNKTEILQSNFEITNRESESQQITSQENYFTKKISLVSWNIVNFHKISYNLIKSHTTS